VRRLPDGCLYLVTDRRFTCSRPLEAIVAAAVRGGASAVQLREKDCGTREFVSLARALQSLLAPLGVPLLVNDRPDVALAAGAAGVHLGQSDLPCEEARALLGPNAILGLSVDTLEQAHRAASLPVDYLGVSPVFATPTKTDTAPAWGLDNLVLLRRTSRHQLIAIGGIHAGNAADVLTAGADGIAVVSAICAVADPEAAARELLASIARGLQQRAV